MGWVQSRRSRWIYLNNTLLVLLNTGNTSFLSLYLFCPTLSHLLWSLFWLQPFDHGYDNFKIKAAFIRCLWRQVWGRRRTAGRQVPQYRVIKEKNSSRKFLSCFSHVWLSATLWTVAHWAPLSMGFSRQDYWSGLPWPSPGNLPNPGFEPVSLVSPALAGRLLSTTTAWA